MGAVPPTIRALGAAFASDASSIERLVMASLAMHANVAGEAWPSHARLAEMCNVSIPTLRRHLAALRERGLLEIRQRDGRGDRADRVTNRYILTFARVLTSEHSSGPNGCSPASSRDTERVLKSAPTGAQNGHERVLTADHLNLKDEPIGEPEDQKPRNPTPQRPASRGQTVDAFDAPARAVVDDWWRWFEAKHGKKPAAGFLATVNTVKALLRSGHEPAAIAKAFAAVGGSRVTVAAAERELLHLRRATGTATEQWAQQFEEIAGSLNGQL